MGTEIPDTHVNCDGCGAGLNLLAPYLTMMMRAKRDVLVSEEVASADPNEVPEGNIYLGSISGRGVIKKFHDFDCMGKWVRERKGLPAKLEYHTEEAVAAGGDN